MNDSQMRQAAAEKRAQAAWEAVVASTVSALSRELAAAAVPAPLHDVWLSPRLVALIAQLLDVPGPEASALMLKSLQVEVTTENLGGSAVGFLLARLAAFQQLVDEGYAPATLLKIAGQEYGDLRLVLGLPCVESLLEAYVVRRCFPGVVATCRITPKRTSDDCV